MEKPNLSLFVAEQFPEHYREEFPQIITFMEKYYEYLETTESGRVDNLRNIDASLNRFIAELKSEMAKNVPSFGMVSDADFLKVAKQFYLTRGSEDSFKFLMRAMFGVSVDILYPGENILKASDGRWTQEVSLRVEISGPVTDLINTSNIRGNYFLLRKDSIHVPGDIHTEGQHDLGSSFLCTNVKKITDTIYDLFVERTFKATVETGDIFDYVNKDGIHIPGVVINAVIRGQVLNGGPGAAALASAGKQGFFAGAAYIIPGAGPNPKNCIVRITAMDSTDTTKILAVDVISQGNGFTASNYIGIRPQTRTAYFISSTFGDFTNLTYNPDYQIGDAFLRIDVGPLMRYRGFYSSTRGFLSDDVKMQDNNYYQNSSYVLRLDAQLASYKNAVMSLLHPDGMALWGQYELRNNISITPTLRDAIREFLLLYRDVAAASDVWLHDTTLPKPDFTVAPDIWLHDTTMPKSDITTAPDVWLHDTTLVKPDLAVAPDVWKHDTNLTKPDITTAPDVWKHDTNLTKPDLTVAPDVWKHDSSLVKADITTTPDVWALNTSIGKPDLIGASNPDPAFDINKSINEPISFIDSGQLLLILTQDYTTDTELYLSAINPDEAYLTGANTITRNW